MCFLVDKNSRFTVQSFIRKADRIQFIWTDVGGTYKVYCDGQQIYEGTVASFTDGRVEEGSACDYTIERIDEGRTEVIRLQTSACIEDKAAKNPLTTTGFTTIVHSHSIVLVWEVFEGVQTYEIYRNDVLLAEVKGNQYIDTAIANDQSYTYRVQYHRSIARSGEKFRQARRRVSKVLLKMEGKKAKKESIERFTLVKKIGPLQQLLQSIESRKQSSKKLFTLRYATFIAEPIVNHAHMLSKHRYFRGDNRDFHPEGQTYRTRVDVIYNLADLKQPIICSRDVGPTVSFNRFGHVQKRRFAQGNGISVQKYVGDEKGFRLEHAVQNPIVFAPYINYEVDATIHENGHYDISGWHDEAPHHEVYVSFDGGKWEPVHLAKSKGLIWLTDIMGVHYWRFSMLI